MAEEKEPFVNVELWFDLNGDWLTKAQTAKKREEWTSYPKKSILEAIVNIAHKYAPNNSKKKIVIKVYEGEEGIGYDFFGGVDEAAFLAEVLGLHGKQI